MSKKDLQTKEENSLLPQKSEVALREEKIQAFWEENDIFNKSLKTPAGKEPVGDFVFYDGPPFATGLPHYGHILASTIKDAIPRFWTMNGYHVRRQWGWDCHGLPLENLIEKKLGLATKRDIEEYGIKKFNEAARDTVMEYADDWGKIVPRMGRFADMDNDYKTMDSTYTESVWWVFSELNKKGLVFEGFKSMHLCPRCGTTLSNFEVNLGYKDIKDFSVTVRLPLLDEDGKATDTSLLVWTTTPWTLPGNLAAAVHNDHVYVKVKVTKEGEEEQVILAKERLVQLGTEEYEVVEELKGSDLVGKKYEPPFPYLKDQDMHPKGTSNGSAEGAEGKKNAWQVYHADYVELGDEGTGAVHLAPAYGEEDMELAKKHGVPIFHHVDDGGHFKEFVGDMAGQLVKPKDDDEAEINHMDTDIEIIKALAHSGKLFAKEKITHSYPHCWRCDTPLLNYATTSWFVDVPSIKKKLVSENKKVNWVPEHVGTNRFGKWLEGARDWAVSRQRYWGAPLPIWKNPETKEYKIFGSLKELQKFVPTSGNKYLIMRHGEATSNLEGRISAVNHEDDPLTEKGIEQVRAVAKELPDIDMIVHSGFLRTRNTAELVAEELGLSKEAIVEEERIKELQAGADLEGQTWAEYQEEFGTELASFTEVRDGRENRFDVIKRAAAALYDLEEKYKDKKILIVGHASSLFGLMAAAQGMDEKKAQAYKKERGFLDNAELCELDFVPLPHNDNYILDYHRPYIDEVELYEGEVKLERIPDVFDCWFESGSMPYAQHHYPFENEADFEKKHFPAQFIAEGLDQTRGWFYSLIVLGTALFGKSPFENVIVNGLALAEDGKKMSKSLQNYPDPMELVARNGADAMRFYLMSSPIIRGEDLNFSEKETAELQRKNIGRLHNVLTMYEQYNEDVEPSDSSENVLDKWILSRLNQLITESTEGYKNYELDKAVRPITSFIDDLSVWYLRRSRERLKGDDIEDKKATLATMRFVFRQLALVMAPVMPFYAEYLWQQVKTKDDQESVHLGVWPEAGKIHAEILETMNKAREIVTRVLELRVNDKIKVRQPLKSVTGPDLGEVYHDIIKEEVNVKEYQIGEDEMIKLDTEIDSELKAEGDVREFVRALQDMRKNMGLLPQDIIELNVQTSAAGEAILKKFETDISKTVGTNKISFIETSGQEVTAGEHSFVVEVKKL